MSTSDKNTQPQFQAVHRVLPEGSDNETMPYRDNSYFVVWDTKNQFTMVFYVWNTPNASAMIRVTAIYGNDSITIREPIEEHSECGFITRSKSVEFDLRNPGIAKVNHPDLCMNVEVKPKFERALPSGEFIPVEGGKQTHFHYEWTTIVMGSCTYRGKQLDLNAVGYRDRAIGFREENQMFSEHILFFATFEDYTVQGWGFLSADRKKKIYAGALYNEDEIKYIKSFPVMRDEAGLFHSSKIVFDDDSEMTITLPERDTFITNPLEIEKVCGPIITIVLEFGKAISSDGNEGYCKVEHSVMRELF